MVLVKKNVSAAMLVSSLAVLALFSIFFIGSRNPLKPIGIEIPEPRVIFWALVALCGATILRLVLRRRLPKDEPPFTRSAYLWALPLVYFGTLITFALINKRPAAEISELIAIAILIVTFMVLAPFTRPENLSIFWLVVVVMLFFFLILAFVQGPKDSTDQYTALDVGRIMFARYMGYGAIITWFFAIYTRHRWLLIPSFAFILFTAMTGARGVVVALVATAVLSVVFLPRRIWLSLFFVGSGAILAFFTFGPWPISVLQKRFAQLSLFNSAGRDQIWTEQLAQLLSAPWRLFTGSPSPADGSHGDSGGGSGGGAGSGGGSGGSLEGASSHNIFIDSLSHAGVLGLILIVLVFIVAIPPVFTAMRREPLVSLPALLTAFMFVCVQFSGTQHDNALLWFFFMLTVLQSIRVLSRRTEAVPDSDITSPDDDTEHGDDQTAGDELSGA